MSKISKALTDTDTLAHVERVWASNKPNSPIYNFLLSEISLTFASKGLVRARLQLTKNHVNSKGGLHGIVSACLIDWVGGLAIAAYDRRDQTGVSTDMHITYISSAREGDWVEVEGKASKVGGTLAFTQPRFPKLLMRSRGQSLRQGHTRNL